MLKNLTLLLTLLLVPAGCMANDAVETSEVLKLKIHRHASWSDTPLKGVDADGLRMNLAPGDSLTFKDISLTVTKMTAAPGDTGTDQVNITMKHGETSETRTLDEGAAFNWNGYHVAIVAIYGKKGELGFGSTVVEIATVSSLPKEVAESTKANGAEHRLRIKHNIDKLTLHHSATPHAAEDNLGEKLSRMQTWGANDRNWFTIPYHFIIDTDGSILEARNYQYVGDTNTRYDPRGHFLINCYGNYNEAEPNQQQLQSIAALMAWAAEEFSIDPIKIYGHRDLAPGTACPGDNLYKYIQDGRLKKMVEDIRAKGKPELVWTNEKKPD